MSNSVFSAHRNAILQTIQNRFLQTLAYHPLLSWPSVIAALDNHSGAIDVLLAMEDTGGEPNVVDDPANPQNIVFMDCSPESPIGRRSLCYDSDALAARKANKPQDSAVHMAENMGIELLSEAQYRELQRKDTFDQKTSSWILTPPKIRKLGGALFCDRRYDTVFLYHNGADSYYAVRGFRGYFAIAKAL